MAFSTFDALVTQLEQAAAASGERALGAGTPRALRAIAHEINNVLGATRLELWIGDTACGDLSDALDEGDIEHARQQLEQMAESYSAIEAAMKKLATVADRLAAADLPAGGRAAALAEAGAPMERGAVYSLKSQLALANST